ncbi:MAG: aminopeptidase [Nocardioides sp.]|uniref:M28 family peptidase n=1 Tax=Nocardioides sp. TaxID=35761 RepID=UPI00260D6C72|nr:M28 family peptidase [Nocardioides sp.]MCW2834589.1 aminopeptidase [Nocardioides sp.]
MNEGQAGRTAALAGTLGGPQSYNAPVVGTSFAIGDDLRNGVINVPTGSTVRVKVDRVNENRTTENHIAETPTGDPDNVVVVGAHLDRVTRDPGINDNGSGSAGILEIAEQFAARGIEPRNKVRFIWWSVEGFGLLGSRAYVAEQTPAQLAKIRLNLNFDMIGSPNFVRFAYDGDNSRFPVGRNSADGPQGSDEIERVFHDYVASQGLASSETAFSGRSDYGPAAGPVSGSTSTPGGGGLHPEHDHEELDR